MKLTNLGEAAVRLETLAEAPGTAIANGMLFGNGRHFPVFGAPYVTQTASYSVGDTWLYLRLGEEQPNGLNGDSVLHGCYGMSHSFDVEVTNPSSAPLLVFLVLRASAGEVKGQFYLDDEYVVTPLVASGEEMMLKEIPLKPGETKLLKVRAIPLNGGFYPASLIVRQTRYP